MAEFFCPEYGSTHRVAEETVRFPYQCPGCDSVVDASGTAVAEEPEIAGKPVRVQLLKIAEWSGAEKTREPRALADPRSWIVAAAAVVILGAIAIAWFRYPQTPEDATVQASDSEATSAAAPHPARQRKQREPGTDRNASSDLAPAARNAREGTAGARAEENARRVAEAGQAHAALLEPPATELSQADLRKAIPRGTPTAVALFSGVPILRQPKWAGTPVQVLNTSDLLVVVDSKRRSGWICVMSVASGAEGWVPVNRVRINPGEQ